MLVESVSQFFEKLDIPSGLLFVLRILVVDIQAVQSNVFHDFDGTLNELLAERRRNDNRMER